MKKKIILGLIAIILLASLYLYTRVSTNSDVKSITINIKDDQSYVINTNASTLGQALDESKIMFTTEGNKNDQFGRLITSINSIENSVDSNSFWGYNSTNNKQCIKDTFCSGIDVLKIEDGDTFSFEYVKY